MFYDPQYLLFAIPGLILALLASMVTKSTFARYSRIRASSGFSGAQAAARLLKNAGIYDVAIEQSFGFLSDHYDPISRKLRLSPQVYGGTHLSAIGVACHEAGHAIQHKLKFAPLHLRTALVPLTNFSNWTSYIIIAAGFLMQNPKLILAGAILFSAAVIFSIITLPVEWDASNRAKKLMVETGIVEQTEAKAAAAVLNAAFMTYVAAAVSSLLTLLYYLMRAGVFGNRRD